MTGTEESQVQDSGINKEALIEPPRKTEVQKAVDKLQNNLTQLENMMLFVGSMHQGRVAANFQTEVWARIGQIKNKIQLTYRAYLDALCIVACEAEGLSDSDKITIKTLIEEKKQEI